MIWICVLLFLWGLVKPQTGFVEGNEEFFKKLPSRRLQQSLSYYAPQNTNGVASVDGNTPPVYGSYGGYTTVAQTLNQLQQPQTGGRLTVNSAGQVVGIPSTGFQTGARATTATGFITPTTVSNTVVQAQNILSGPAGTNYPPGLYRLAAAPLAQQLEVAGLSKEKMHEEKNAKAVEGLQFVQGVKNGLKQKRRYIREEFLKELNRSPKNDVGQITVQKATNYAYQHGDDVINIGSTQGAQKMLGPSPSTLTPEQLFQSGFQQGLNQGALSGAQTGFNAGFAGGFLQGFQTGFQQGLNQGVSGVATGIPTAVNDPSYQQGFEEGIQVGLNQGLQAALDLIKISQGQDINGNGEAGQETTPNIGQEEMNKLAEDALLGFLQGLLENEDGSDVEEPVAAPKEDVSVSDTPSPMSPGEQKNSDRGKIQTQSLPSQTGNDSPAEVQARNESSGEVVPNDATTDKQQTQRPSESALLSSVSMNETMDTVGVEEQVGAVDDMFEDPDASEVIDLFVIEALRIVGTDRNLELKEGAFSNVTQEAHSRIVELTADALSRAGLGEVPLSITEVTQEDILTVADTLSLDVDLVSQIEEILRDNDTVESKSTRDPIWVVLEDPEEPPVFISTMLQNEERDDELQSFQDRAQKNETEPDKEPEMSVEQTKRITFSQWHLYGAGIALGAVAIIGVFCFIYNKKARV